MDNTPDTVVYYKIGWCMGKFIEGLLFGAGFTIAYIVITKLAHLIGL